MDDVSRLETILNYPFSRKELALRAMGRAGEEEFKRLRMLGESRLNLNYSRLFYEKYPKLGPKQLNAARAANLSNGKLAYNAVMNGIHHLLLTDVSMFRIIGRYEDSLKTGSHYNMVKPPHVLADLLKAIVGAIDQDREWCHMDKLWEVCGPILDPLIEIQHLSSQEWPLKQRIPVGAYQAAIKCLKKK